MSEISKKIEAILFAIGRAVSEDELAILSKENKTSVHEALVELKKHYEARESPLLIIQEGDAWKLTVHEKYVGVVQQINPHTELSKTILETLAVIAWKQPAKQSEVITIRTNKAYEHIEELERLGFVAKEKYGRTYLLKVTSKFYDYFDLPSGSTKEIFKDVKDVGEAQSKLTEHEVVNGLQTYGVNDAERLKQEGKEHIDGLEVVDVSDVPETKEDLFSDEKDEIVQTHEDSVDEIPSPQESTEPFTEEREEKSEETAEPSEEKESEPEERTLNSELESFIEKKKR